MFCSGSINFFLSISLELNTEGKISEQKTQFQYVFRPTNVCLCLYRKLSPPDHLVSIITKLSYMNLLFGACQDLLSFVSIGQGPHNKGFLLKKIYINLLEHVCNREVFTLERRL